MTVTKEKKEPGWAEMKTREKSKERTDNMTKKGGEVAASEMTEKADDAWTTERTENQRIQRDIPEEILTMNEAPTGKKGDIRTDTGPDHPEREDAIRHQLNEWMTNPANETKRRRPAKDRTRVTVRKRPNRENSRLQRKATKKPSDVEAQVQVPALNSCNFADFNLYVQCTDMFLGGWTQIRTCLVKRIQDNEVELGASDPIWNTQIVVQNCRPDSGRVCSTSGSCTLSSKNCSPPIEHEPKFWICYGLSIFV